MQPCLKPFHLLNLTMAQAAKFPLLLKLFELGFFTYSQESIAKVDP